MHDFFFVCVGGGGGARAPRPPPPPVATPLVMPHCALLRLMKIKCGNYR